MVILHGAGDLGALGVPLPLLLLLGAATVPALAGALSARATALDDRPAPRLQPLPRWVCALVDARATRALARAAGLMALVAVVVMAALGPQGMSGNPAPRLALVVLWGGLATASLLLGPVWRAVNPFRTLTRWVCRIVDPGGAAARPLPPGIGVWPAAAAILVWAWVAEARPTPAAVLLLLLGYTAAQVAAGIWFGPAWFGRGDGLEALSTLLGRLSPLTRDPQGRPALRRPLSGLTRLRPPPGTRALVTIVLAWELAHAVRATTGWPGAVMAVGLRPGIAASTGTLLLAVLVAGLLVRMATPRAFLLPALVPLVAGWVLSHHVGPVVTDWRAALADLADPLGRGWELFPASGPPVEAGAPGVIALVQLLVLLAGCLVAVLAAHRGAVARYDLRAARAVQFPFRVLVIGAVLGGLLLQATAAP